MGFTPVLSRLLNRVFHPEPIAWPPPRTFTPHETWLLEQWYEHRLFKSEHRVEGSGGLYDGIGWSLKAYLERYATEPVAISKMDMLQFLRGKDCRVVSTWMGIRVFGVQRVLLGNSKWGIHLGDG